MVTLFLLVPERENNKMTVTPIMLWGQGDDAVTSFLRCWRIFRSLRRLRLGDNFFPHVSGKAFEFFSTKEQDLDICVLLSSAMTCGGMKCGIAEGAEIIHTHSEELQRQFP
jgi:hypothetical protein